MKMQTTLLCRFDYRHAEAVFPPFCPTTLHGHDWTMKITAAGNFARSGQTFDDEAMRAINLLLTELDRSDPVLGTNPTPEGIAAYAVERLRAFIPGLASVRVGIDSGAYESTCEV